MSEEASAVAGVLASLLIITAYALGLLVSSLFSTNDKIMCSALYERSYSAADTLAVTREFPYCAKHLGDADG